jgi:YfiH family protein
LGKMRDRAQKIHDFVIFVQGCIDLKDLAVAHHLFYTEVMQRHIHANGVATYTFDLFAGLPMRAHVSTRHGGVSPAPWNTLNFSILRGDAPERVQQNQQRLADALGLNLASIIRCRQTHGTRVAKVDDADAGQWQEDCDALITDSPELPLMLVFADCAPLVFYDRRRHALGICHAGWRGALNGAAAVTVWALQAAYDTNPVDVIAGIGPSIGPYSYPVGPEVVELAQAKLPNADRFFHYSDGSEGQPYLDLWQVNLAQMVEAGIPRRQIEVSEIDTAQNTQDFFSHRAERGECGLFGMVAWLA